MHLGRALLGAATATLATGALFTAAAFVEAPQNGQFEVPLAYPEFDPHQVGTSRLAEAKSAIEDAVSARLGGTWQVPMMNTYSRTPRYVLGSGIELGVDVSSDIAAEAAARSVVATNPDVFGSASNDLQLWDVRRGGGKLAVHFQQTYHGLEVWGARAHVTMTDGARAYAFKSNIFNGIDIDHVPSLNQSQAVEIAKNGVLFDATTDAINGEPQLMVLPMGVSPVDVEHRLVWKIRVETADPIGIWVTHVDAQTGDILWRWNDVHFIDVTGSAESDVQPGTYCNGSEVQASPWLDVDIVGGSSATSDINGDFVIPHGGSSAVTVTADLYGPWVDLDNNQGAEALFSGSATPSTPFTLAWDDANSRADERTVFDGVNDVHDFIELFDPGYSYSNTRISAIVNRSQTCNAYWNGTINFYNAGGGCANTGEIAGVVHHEFGHGIQDNLIGFQGNEGLGEGNGDILSNLLTGESVIGRGFFQGDCVGGIRDCDNNFQYPSSLTGQVHNDGQVIAGFNWDYLVNTKATFGDEAGTVEAGKIWHFARKLETPTVQPDQVIAYFIHDDDDGDLGNGTPNYDNICDAAVAHDFEEYCPEIIVGVFVAHDAIACTEDGSNLVVTALITSTEAIIEPASVEVLYTINGGVDLSLSMSPTGNPDEYSATLPASESPTSFAYYVTADDIIGNTGTSPRSAPIDRHEFDVATVVELMETDPSWTVNPDGTDDATTGIWARVDPIGTGAQPENDATPTGTMCWITGPAGGSLGNDDIDNGTTTLQSAGYNISGAFAATLRYQRWYSNNQGADPNNDLWVVQVRNNGGSWIEVENTQSDQGQWTPVEFDLFAEFGAFIGNIEVRFIGSDLNSGSVVEAGVDDFKLLADLDGIVDVEVDSSPSGVPMASFMDAAHPNPFNPRTTISYGINANEKVSLAIYDVNGRLVRTLVNTNQVAGNYAVVWDGRDDNGRDVASGVYYSRVKAGSFSTSSKLNLLK
jgi:hypothetical protein